MSSNNLVITLKRNFYNLDINDPFYTNQCKDLHERYVFDVTSRNTCEHFIKYISPMYIGPVYTTDNMICNIFEIYWQCGKVYPCHDNNGIPNESYFKWRNSMYSKKIGELPKEKLRHPNEDLGYNRSDCRYFAYFNPITLTYEQLDYITARKQVYIKEYAKLVYDTESFDTLRNLVSKGEKIALLDFDTYNFTKENKNIKDILNDKKPAGHGYVLKMLLDNTISVTDNIVNDPTGVLDINDKIINPLF